MAVALAPYFREVVATDVFDYGFGRVADFLKNKHPAQSFDWVITNPPFRLGEEFISRSMDIARRGVAMLTRTVFIESVGRYERLFKVNPPPGLRSSRNVSRWSKVALTRRHQPQQGMRGWCGKRIDSGDQSYFGYTDGGNVRLEARFHGGAVNQPDEMTRGLVALKPNIILASNPYAIRAVLNATRDIPVVGVDLESDPVASGLVKSLSRPGGNFTGFFLDIPELGGKQIELLMEAVPGLTRVAIVWDATIGEVQFRATEGARRPKGVVLQSLPIRRAEDFDAALEQAVRNGAQGVILLSSPLIFLQRAHIADVAAKARLPTISLFTSFPRFGGLMAYGPNFASIFTQAAEYVVRILAGARPGELPIQRPTKFELIINAKAASAIGLDLPPALLARADEVIE
jgi:putative ABC transport system substrate-binding protein